MAKKTYTWKDPGGLSTIYVILLAALAGASALNAVLAATGGYFTGDESDLTSLQLANWWATMLFVALLVASVITAWIWALRVNRNAHTFGRTMTYTPASMIYWYIVPLMSLFKPFGAIEEVWEVSGDRKTGLLRWWWGTFLIDNALGALSSRINDPVVEMVSGVASAISPLLFIFIVLKLVRLQRQAHSTTVFSDGAAA